MLSLKQLTDKCMLYSDNYKRCRYLARDPSDSDKWYCLKLSSTRQDLDDELAEMVKDLTKKGLDPLKQGIPLGDNCDGYPILRNIPQGYDHD